LLPARPGGEHDEPLPGMICGGVLSRMGAAADA
jgi:hypothetical protein